MHHVPSLIRSHSGRKRWHRRAIETGHEIPKHVLIRFATLNLFRW